MHTKKGASIVYRIIEVMLTEAYFFQGDKKMVYLRRSTGTDVITSSSISICTGKSLQVREDFVEKVASGHPVRKHNVYDKHHR